MTEPKISGCIKNVIAIVAGLASCAMMAPAVFGGISTSMSTNLTRDVIGIIGLIMGIAVLMYTPHDEVNDR